MTPEDATKATQYLVDSAIPYAEARARQTKAEAMLRHTKALAMKASGVDTVSGQEREAYASQQYLTAIEELSEATLAVTKIQALREAAKIKVDLWRSLNASLRGAGV